GFIFRLTNQDPPAIVSVKHEGGLRAVTALSGVNILDLLLNNAYKSFPDRYLGFNVETEVDIDVAGIKSKQIVFTYSGPSGNIAKQRFVIIPKDSDSAILISLQSTELDYEELNSLHFNYLVESIQL
ncbi:MAG: hypothetical protein ACI9T8_000167, partial [Candidatus Saccharimonadales bacterium]